MTQLNKTGHRFLKYPKIHRLGKSETEGILDGQCYIQEKIDGANTSIWMDEDGTIHCGSRNNDLTYNKVVDMWRAQGLKCLQVAEGNF